MELWRQFGANLCRMPALARRSITPGRFRWHKIKFPTHVRVLKRPLPRAQAVAIRAARDVASLFFTPPLDRAYQRQRPHILDAPAWLEREMAAVHAKGPAQMARGGIAILPHVSILAGGVVATSDGTIVAESLINTHEARRFGPFTRPPGADPQIAMRVGARQRRLTPEPHILLKQTYDKNYGHWLIECLPRLAIVAKYFDLSQCKVIVSDWSVMRQVYRDSLQAFGIAPDQIVELGYESAHVDKLIYPLPITDHPWIKSPALVEALETVPARVASRRPRAKRIYVSRNRYHKRWLLNERAILEVCEAYDFEVIHPEKMSFADQVHAFANADLVVGNCGASLANIVFSPRGATLLALTSPHMHDSFFWDLASLKDIRYVSLHGVAAFDARGRDDAEPMDLDFAIDVERFARLLAELIAWTWSPPPHEPASSTERALVTWR